MPAGLLHLLEEGRELLGRCVPLARAGLVAVDRGVVALRVRRVKESC
jgi:hypothetical protein